MRRRATGLGAATVAFGVLVLLAVGSNGVAAPTKVGTSIRTEVHNPAHQVVSVVELGTPVHEFAFMKTQPGVPPPTGNVEVLYFTDGTCSTFRAGRSDLLGPLDPSGAFDAVGFPLALSLPGTRAFRVNYLGDANYFAVDSACDKVVFVPPPIVGIDSVSIPAWARIDSYDSAVDPLLFVNGPGNSASVFSNGSVALGYSETYGKVRSATSSVSLFYALVTGDVRAGAAVNKTGGLIGGTTTANSPTPALSVPAVPSCSPFSSGAGVIPLGNAVYNAGTGDLVANGFGNQVFLAPGTYCFHNLTLNGSGLFPLQPGQVKIVVTGKLLLNGSSSLNCGGAPTAVQVASSYSGANGVILTSGGQNTACASASLYAPTTDISVDGILFGTVLGKTLKILNGSRIHYDVQALPAWAQYFP